jgi:hypothetical protein
VSFLLRETPDLIFDGAKGKRDIDIQGAAGGPICLFVCLLSRVTFLASLPPSDRKVVLATLACETGPTSLQTFDSEGRKGPSSDFNSAEIKSKVSRRSQLLRIRLIISRSSLTCNFLCFLDESCLLDFCASIPTVSLSCNAMLSTFSTADGYRRGEGSPSAAEDAA